MTIDLSKTAPPVGWGVAVDEQAISELANGWADVAFTLPDFDYAGTPSGRSEGWWFDYVTLAVSVLACLWPPEGSETWHVEHDGVWLDDAPAVFASFARLIVDDQIDLDRVSHLSDAGGRALFAGRGTLQMIPERVQILRSVAEQLQRRWSGSALHLVDAAGRDGREIVRLLIETIPAYVDRPITAAGQAHFDKLAHLAAAVMAAGSGWHRAGFQGYDDFPVYPDYMLPRVFRHFGIMRYAPELAMLVDERRVIPKDSNAEHALRWATVYAGARLMQSLRDAGVQVTGPALDYRLWSIAVLGPDADRFGEHHRTVTLAY